LDEESKHSFQNTLVKYDVGSNEPATVHHKPNTVEKAKRLNQDHLAG
jgi:hypothetical protein